MDLTEDAASDLGAIIGIAVSYIFVAAFNTIRSKIIGSAFSLFLRHVLLQTRIRIYPAMWIHVTLFSTMPDTLEWLQAAWALMTRDEPPEGLPGPEVANIVTKGLLLVLYVIEALSLNYAMSILSLLWSHFFLLSCFGIGLVAVFPLSAKLFLWFGAKKRVERYKNESILNISLRFLLTAVVQVGVSVYKFSSSTLRLKEEITSYLRATLNPILERYPLRSPKYSYQYEGLDSSIQEIRLIKLTKHPIAGISCSLERFSLKSAPKYEAISYTWGSSKKGHLVFFGRSWLPTTRNVYKILQDRGSYFRTRWLWIDAVCINQDDNDEKGIQVNIMGDIYQSAERVLVWLGDAVVKSSDVTAAMFLLEKLNYNIHNYEYYKPRLDSMELVTGSQDSWNALARLLSHCYWQRTWIIQEIAKAHKVHILYGGRYISWDIFSRMLGQLAFEPGNKIMSQELVEFKSNSAAIIGGISQVSLISAVREPLTHGKLLTLEECLALTYRCLATDARDKVFALTNLIKLIDVDEQTDVRPDYTLTVQEVYTRTARYMLPTNSSFLLLQSGIGHERKVDGLPSWVPDWSALRPRRHQVDSDLVKGDQASGPGSLQSPKFTLSANLLEISVQGITISKTKHISAIPYSFDGSSEAGRQGVQSFYQAAHLTATTYLPDIYNLTNQSLIEAFWRTLIADRHPTHDQQRGSMVSFESPAQREYGEFFKIWRDGMLGLDEPAVQLSDDEGLRVKNASFAYSRALSNACSDSRKFAVTEDGMMALVPPLTEVGDEIFFLSGAEKPVLLRIGDVERGTYRLVGECYVHGIMDGTSWNNGTRARTLTIC